MVNRTQLIYLVSKMKDDLFELDDGSHEVHLIDVMQTIDTRFKTYI